MWDYTLFRRTVYTTVQRPSRTKGAVSMVKTLENMPDELMGLIIERVGVHGAASLIRRYCVRKVEECKREHKRYWQAQADAMLKSLKVLN